MFERASAVYAAGRAFPLGNLAQQHLLLKISCLIALFKLHWNAVLSLHSIIPHFAYGLSIPIDNVTTFRNEFVALRLIETGYSLPS